MSRAGFRFVVFTILFLSSLKPNAKAEEYFNGPKLQEQNLGICYVLTRASARLSNGVLYITKTYEYSCVDGGKNKHTNGWTTNPVFISALKKIPRGSWGYWRGVQVYNDTTD